MQETEMVAVTTQMHNFWLHNTIYHILHYIFNISFPLHVVRNSIKTAFQRHLSYVICHTRYVICQIQKLGFWVNLFVGLWSVCFVLTTGTVPGRHAPVIESHLVTISDTSHICKKNVFQANQPGNNAIQQLFALSTLFVT